MTAIRTILGFCLLLLTTLATPVLHAADKSAGPAQPPAAEKIIGIYVHQHWPYNHPYAAREWSLEDWEGYVDGVKQLGYNVIQFWPVIETMPDPLTKSDEAYLEKCRQVIDMIHSKGMKVFVCLCPNVIADDAVAGQMTFEDRVFFFCDLRVNPGDAEAMERMMKRREKQLRPLAQADAFVVIDSDPGGYPGSTTEEFVALLGAHRKMLDQLRPGIEMLYWMHVGWPGYCRWYETGKFEFSTEAEFDAALKQLKELNPEPWGLAGNIHHANRVGQTDRAIDYRYGSVEGEPTFPLTNFGSDRAYQAGLEPTGRGVMANAQTHCLQLPYIFAFARGAQGKPLAEADYVEFADQLLPGHGAEIVAGWTALTSVDTEHMLATAASLEKLAAGDLKTGPLKGLMFGDPQRFLTDIAMQLRLRAAGEKFIVAQEQENADANELFAAFVDQFSQWQERHGYRGRVIFEWKRLDDALTKLDAPEINAVLHPEIDAPTPFAKIKEDYAIAESASANLVKAMQATADRLAKESK
ncbi:hypothetical protein [Lacipirellula sp.]|uniref:hypothetical protein n=1 Tax=Lacipirellula sp. TaxID=2691419 RepID=UPI003D0FEABF